MNKKFFICAMLVLMLFICVNAGSAAEPLNDALGADISDEIAISDVSNDALSASGGGDYATTSDAVGAADGGQTISVENDDDSEADNATLLKSAGIGTVYNSASSDVANVMPIADSAADNIVTQDNFYNFFDDSGILLDNVAFDELIFQGEFSDLTTYLVFNRPISVIGDAAVLNDMGIVISDSDVSLRNLTLIAGDVDFGDYTGAVISVTNDNAVLDGLTIDYAPGEDYDAYAIFINANDFQLLNCDVNFTGSSLGDNYEYAMKIVSSNVGLIRGNTIRANLPILDVDYGKGDPGLDTDLVLNTGIKESYEIDIINNTFIANVIDCYGYYPTLDCVMLESCDGVNVINNTFNESDFLIEEGVSNYLNVLDMYYSDNVLVQGNKISVETTGGAENAGTAYPVQLTGPYENVVIDGNDLYAQCGGPALGVFSQNYYGDTEITVQNNNIDITGLPTTDAWGLVSGIELQDTVARVYNNTIKTKSVTGTYEEGDNLYGISYAQALNDNHCYDIQNNTVETEGKYTIYILKAQDTIITGNSLASSLLEGDDSVYIRDASGDTVIVNNSGIDTPENIVTPENFFDFFDEDGFLLDSVTYDELIFKGEFDSLVESIVIITPITITGDGAVLNNILVLIDSGDVILDNLVFFADDSLGGLITVDGGNNIVLSNLDINYSAGVEEAVAIDLKSCQDVSLVNSNIFFESHVIDDTLVSVGIQAVDTEYVLMDNNNITTQLPCVYVYTYDEDYYLMGSNNVNPVRLKDCNNLVFTNNFVNSTTNDYSAEFPTIQSIYIIGCTNSLIDHNDIYMIDEMTPAGLDNYLYGIDFGHNYNVTFSYNNFVMSTKGGKDAAGTAYAFQGVESTVNIVGNNITSVSNGPNLGIYVASMFGGTSTLYIADNFINVTGSASSSGSWALVSGIEIQNGDAEIYNNTIYTYNVNEYQDEAFMYGISYAQWMYGDRSFDIQNNTVYTEGKYTISVINASSFYAEGNKLYAHELTGSDSIDTGACQDVIIGDNYPPSNLTNVVTKDTFFSFFDDAGVLKESIAFDELIFNGTFSDLVDVITFNRAINVTGENAVLDNIAIRIAGDDVALSGFTLNANNEFADNNGALIYATGSGIEISGVVVNYTAPSEAESIAVYANAAENFKFTNSEIAFVSTNPGSKHNYGLEIRGSENVLIDNNIIDATLPAVDVSWSGSGIDTDLVLAVGIQGGKNIVFADNIVIVNTNSGIGSYPTIDAVMIHSVDNVSVISNGITLIDSTTSDVARYYYTLDIYSSNATAEGNSIIVNTTSGIDRTGTAYPIQVTSSTVTINNNGLTAVSKGPTCGIYASNWNGPAKLTIENNTIDIAGYATAGGYALVAAIEAEIDLTKVYNNTITVANFAAYDDTNPVYGVSMTSSYMSGDAAADIKDNTITVDGKYAVYYAKAANTNVTGNTLYAHEFIGDDAAFIESGENNVVEDNLPKGELTNIVTQDNFYDFFDDSGSLLDSVEFDELIFQGNFSGLVEYITLERSIAITGDDAVLNDMGFIIAGSNVVLDGLTLVANSNLGNLIDIAGENVVISNSNIAYVVSDSANAINVYGGANGVQILNNNIYFESTVDEYSVDDATNAICVNSGVSIFDDEDPITGLVIDGNNITAVIPAFLADIYENEYYVMGISTVNGVRINGAEDFEFTNNNLDVTTNRLDRTTPTYQAIYVASSSGLIDSNNIIMIDTFTPAGKDVYIDAMVLIYDEELTISNNNFNISTTGGKEESGSAYAVVAIASDFTMDENNITTVSNGPNLAVYFPSNMGSPCDVLMTNNFFNVTGLATSAHDTGLVSGVEVQTGTVFMSGNTIYTYNIGDYAEGNYIFAISYAQDGVNSEWEIINNTIYTEGHYAISLKSANDAVITGNYLVSTDLMGDDAVYIASGSGNTVEDNLPVKPLANITVTADPVWIASNVTVSVSVPNATGTVTIEVNGKSFEVVLVDGVATIVVPAEDLVTGENVIIATYNGPEFASNNGTAVLFVADGVVTQDTYIYYFNQADNGKLFDCVPEGATLDFQGSIINPDQAITVQMNVNKPVNIVTTTGDAYVDLNTTAGSLLGESPGNSFAVTNGGSGSNVTGIYFHNTQLWISNTHDVVLDNISVVVEDQRVGSGVGATSIRDNSSNVVLKNSYLYTRNNGGSTTFTMSWTTNCTIDNCTVRAEGNVGNLIYLNIFNIVGAPSGVPLNNYNKVTNNRIYGKEGSGISVGLMVEGQNNTIENNTLYKSSISTSFGGVNPYGNIYVGNTMTEGGSLTAQPGSIVYNNNVNGTLTVDKESTAYNNVVGKSMTVKGANPHAYNNTVATTVTISGAGSLVENNVIGGAVTISGAGVTFVGNNVTSTVTVNSNGNLITENNIVTEGNYAVDLKAKTDNNVTDNYLIASELKGDDAVNSASETNIIENNRPYETFITVPESLEVLIDGTVKINVSTNSDGNISYSISDDTVASVSDDGIVTGLKAGDAVVTITIAETENYKEASAVVNVTVNKLDATITVPESLDVLIDGTVEINASTGSDGNMSYSISDDTVAGVSDDGVVTGLKAGSAVVTVTVPETDKYNAASVDVSVVVNKKDVSISVDYDAEAYELVATLTNVEGKALNGANVVVSIDGVDYALKTNSKGQAKLSTENLTSGNYNATVSYKGNSKYNAASETVEIFVKKSAVITAPDVSVVYEDESGEFVATLTNDEGKALTGANVVVTLEGVDYALKTNSKGQVKVSTANLTIGTYTATVSYKGNAKYNPATATATVVVTKKDAIISVDYDAVAYELVATLTNAEGKALTGANVVVTLDGVDYALKTNSKGQVKVSTENLTSGNYNVTVFYKGNSKYNAASGTAEIFVKKSAEINAPDISVEFEDESGEFVATLTNNDGQALTGANVVVTLDGVDYSLKTNSKGQVKVSTSNLTIGTYTAAVAYKGNAKYNPATATATVVVTKKVTVISVAYDAEAQELIATLTNSQGKELVTANVIISIDGVDYTLKTNSKGQAKLSTANMTSGYYNVTVSYKGNNKYAAASETTEVFIKKSAIIDAPDVSIEYDEIGEFVATLTNDEGKALTGANVLVTLDGVDYALKTNSKGQVKVSLANMTLGTYTAIVSYKGNAKYAPVTATATVEVTKKATNLSAVYDAESNQLVATLTNGEGKALTGANVVVNLDGVDYTLKTNSKGQAKLSTTDLAPGTYTATVSYKGNSKYAPATTTADVVIE